MSELRLKMTDEIPPGGSEPIRVATTPDWLALSFFRTRNADYQVCETSTIPEEPMTKQNTEDPRIVAASPVVHEPGLLPYRIVIRDLGDQHVVHTQVFEPGRKPWYHQGDYFPKRGDAPTSGESHSESLRKAWARFEERARRSISMEPPPARRLAEVTNIAESIINALLPDDDEDRRELIGDDYQLESDIETFEELTGKVIQPLAAVDG